MNTWENRLTESDKKYCSQGDTSSKRKIKKFFYGAEGNFLIDQENNKYLDFQMFNSSSNLGYQNDIYTNVLNNQIITLPVLSSEFMHPGKIILAENINRSIKRAHGKNGKVHYCVGGAQAVDTALMLLAANKGSYNVFAFEGSYHGRTIAATQVSSSYRYRNVYHGTTNSIFIPFPYCLRCPYEKSKDNCNYFCVKQFERLFSTTTSGILAEKHVSAIKGFIAEPILGRGGYIPAPEEYFQKILEILVYHGILFIDDEIQMGFYRTGKFWGFENYKISPDIIIFGKSITNGLFPLSGIWARNPLMSRNNWPTSSAQATFAAAPIGTSLANKTFELLGNNTIEEHINKQGDKIEDILLHLKAKYSDIYGVHRMGMALSLDIGTKDNPLPKKANKIVEIGLTLPNLSSTKYGLVMTNGGIYNNMITFAPSLMISDEEIELFDDLINNIFKYLHN